MTLIDDMLLTGQIDPEEYAVLKTVDPATVAAAHRKGRFELRALILLHAKFLTRNFTQTLTECGLPIPIVQSDQQIK